MAQHVHVHGQNVPLYLVGIDAGWDQNCDDFINNTDDFPNGLNFQGDINCAACCWTFLVDRRNYEAVTGIVMVYYQNPTTSCLVNGPQGRAGKHSVIQTLHDLNIGQLGPRPTQSSVSYQLYLPDNVLHVNTMAIGHPISARIESISTNALKNTNQLTGCYFNYCSAVMIELCNMNAGRNSFVGTCSSRNPQQFVLTAQQSAADVPPPVLSSDGGENDGTDGGNVEHITTGLNNTHVGNASGKRI